MTLEYRQALPEDASACLEMRGKTRENPASEDLLRSIGVTVDSWRDGIQTGALPGHVCVADDEIVGYCFGDRDTGEIVVVAILPAFENLGIGKEVLRRVSEQLATLGHSRLFLGCTTNQSSRSYGFYRHLGWNPTATYDQYGDEILELFVHRPDSH